MCEMKFYGEEFAVSKSYERKLTHCQNLLSDKVSRRTVIHPRDDINRNTIYLRN